MRPQTWKAPGMLLLAAALAWTFGTEGPARRAGAAGRGHRSGIAETGFDTKARPQDDLFRHVNGGWIDEAKIPAEYGYYGSFMELHDNALRDLRAIIEQAARQADSPEGSEAQKIGAMYSSFMNEARAEKLGLDPVRADLDRIDTLKDKAGLPALFGAMGRKGTPVPLHMFVYPDAKDSEQEIVYLSQGGISLPDESYYRDKKFQPIREAFVAHVEKMFKLAGRPDPAEAAKQVMELETRLAKHHWDRVKNRDDTLTYNKKDRAALDKLAPGFEWARFFEAAGAPARHVSSVIVQQPDFFEAMARILGDVPLEQWKTWMAWNVLNSSADYLNKAIVDEDFDFARKLTGATELPPRWKRGVQLVEHSLGEAAGKLYVARHFPPEAKARMKELVANLIAAYREDISNLKWMGPETRTKALEKLEKFTPKIGYPDKWRDYSTLSVHDDDLLGNVRRAHTFEHDRRLAKLGKPVDRSEWEMTPQTVNAYYNPLFNEIVFPAAILQPPFFDREADDAANYGGIGAVIGHEIGHGFDDQGSKYDGDGNMKNWWTDDDRKEFEKRAKELIEQYNGFSPAQAAGQHVNGALTIGENIGDLGGLTIAHKAYQLSLKGSKSPVINDWTGEQRLFLGWGQIWRSKYRKAELMRRLATDPHSPPEFRCNGVVRNLNEFHDAFNTREGDKLWLPPDQRVRIW